ncbi:MAG: hypothetical protein LQ342_006109 [Letrouitia transgressa]|nr:MAG: hypothetical protein LQ342_006109 [Letrouitia transgressa]
MDGIIADIWAEATERSLPVTFYVFSLLVGVAFGPVLGGAVIGSLYWRWYESPCMLERCVTTYSIRIFYIQLIIYAASLPLIALTFRETRGLVILSNRAKRAHRLAQPSANDISGNSNHGSPPLKGALFGNITRSTYLLCTEPVVFFFTLLSALSYGLVFVSTQSVVQVYRTNYGWAEYQAGLVQLSLVVGELLGFLACVLQNRLFAQAAAKVAAGQPNPHLPEVRLYASIFGSFFGLTGGLFWYGWTSFPYLPWILPSIGLGIVGFGSMVVMQAIMMYITDAYTKYAASASAAICFGENILAAFLPLAATRMYTDLGFRWASCLLAFVALLLSFAPVLLVLRGKEIRRRSSFMEQLGE